ncbi:conserved hypothetical protein [Ricinus communis]|uniref:Uncharacterized protein n=1 Tax=Ricinus communis TaxID=3988 RepID=B9RJF0_RICCO|nr:conserved hypothetical protein [Ricinus communis]
MEASFDASIESLSSWNSAVALNDEINQWSWNQIYEDIAAFDSSVNQQMELPAVWGLESWLLDIDHEPFSFGNGNPQIEQEITSFAGHCESSNPLEQHLANPALDSFY